MSNSSQSQPPDPPTFDAVLSVWVSDLVEGEVTRILEKRDDTENIDIGVVTQRVVDNLDYSAIAQQAIGHLEIPEKRSEDEIQEIAQASAKDVLKESELITRSEAEQMVDQKLAEYSPGNSNTSPSDKEMAAAVGDTLSNIEQTRQAVEFPGRRVGPSKPQGSAHTASLWGIHFTAANGFHIRRAIVDAQEAGAFTAQLGTYDGQDAFEVVAERDIDVDAGPNVITLDLSADSGGEYLLTRAGTFPLRRGEWSGWDDHMMDGLQLHGGAKPGDFEDNSYWYYFFSCEIASGPEYHVEGGYPNPNSTASVSVEGYNGGP